MILPERGVNRPAKILLPVHDRDWRTPSQAQPKNWLGHENQVRFTVTARDRPYGRVLWRGWFDDREDFDNFLHAHAFDYLRYDGHIQRLCAGGEHYGELDPRLLDEPLWWEWHTWHFLAGPLYPTTTSWSVPSDCSGVSGQSGEFIDCIGGGATGGAGRTFSNGRASGGGGGAWSRIVSLSLTPSSSVTTQVGAGGAQVSSTGTGVAGNAGTDTWFNGASLAASSVGAKAGSGGAYATAGTAAGGAGGASGSGIGTSKNSGGAGGDASGATTAAGGAAAASSAGVGGDGVDNATGGTASNGGSVPSGASGSAGAVFGSTTGASNPGGSGTEYDSTHGSGAGSGGVTGSGSGTTKTAGAGGSYGGGSGGANHNSGVSGTAISSVAGGGLIVIVYAPSAKAIPLFLRQTRFFTRKF